MRFHRWLWAAVPIAALAAGCHKVHQAESITPDPPAEAAVRGLQRVFKTLGGPDNGELMKSITAFANTPRGNAPVAGLGKSLKQIVDRAVYLKGGLVTRFDAVNDETVRNVAEFLNGPTSPLQGWHGWRYRSGIIENRQIQDKNLELAAQLGPLATEAKPDSRSIIVVIFDAPEKQR
jgi:hypothetical protein